MVGLTGVYSFCERGQGREISLMAVGIAGAKDSLARISPGILPLESRTPFDCSRAISPTIGPQPGWKLCRETYCPGRIVSDLRQT